YGLTNDPFGSLYVAANNDLEGKSGIIYRVTPDRKVRVVADHKKDGRIRCPFGLRLLNEYHLHVTDYSTGELLEVRLNDGQVGKLDGGFGGAGGVAFDYFGRLYVCNLNAGQVSVIPRAGEKPVLLARGFQNATDACLARDGKSILVTDTKA